MKRNYSEKNLNPTENGGAPPYALTDLERAVCYYTLPKVSSPITIGLLLAYAICVLEAGGALAYGLLSTNRTWTLAGLYALIGIIILGMAAFTVRAALSDWRRRIALAMARNTPPAERCDDIPDPFEHHVLLVRLATCPDPSCYCLTELGEARYRLDTLQKGETWRISDLKENSVYDVHMAHRKKHLHVYRAKQLCASIEEHNTLQAWGAKVFVLIPEQKTYEVSNGCISFTGRLIGRIYTLRDYTYLDVEESHLNIGLLAYFYCMR